MRSSQNEPPSKLKGLYTIDQILGTEHRENHELGKLIKHHINQHFNSNSTGCINEQNRAKSSIYLLMQIFGCTDGDTKYHKF